jgi:hypothetical protein
MFVAMIPLQDIWNLYNSFIQKHTFLESTVRISNLSCQDGKLQNRRRSNLPGLNNAASSRSGLLLDMRSKHQNCQKLIFISHLFSFYISKLERVNKHLVNRKLITAMAYF